MDELVAKTCVGDFNNNLDVVLAIKHWPRAAEAGHTRPIKFLEQDRTTRHLQVTEASKASLLELGWTLDLKGKIEEINNAGRP